MDFTREPIIETIMTPREGYKLIVRNSKSSGQEEYSVDAIEVVSFGNALFFRSQERPKCFLLPVSDYEVVELRETRAVLKTASVDKTIKIGGGKAKEEESTASEPSSEKKRGRRQTRRRKTAEAKKTTEDVPETPEVKEGDKDDETAVSSSVINRLLPPPPGLISETLGKQKDMEPSEEGLVSRAELEGEAIPLPKGLTPEESEPETELTKPPLAPSTEKPPAVLGEAKEETNVLESELKDAKKELDATSSTFDKQVPQESMTPDHPPSKTEKDSESDEPSGDDSSTISRNFVRSPLHDGGDPFTF